MAQYTVHSIHCTPRYAQYGVMQSVEWPAPQHAVYRSALSFDRVSLGAGLEDAAVWGEGTSPSDTTPPPCALFSGKLEDFQMSLGRKTIAVGEFQVATLSLRLFGVCF